MDHQSEGGKARAATLSAEERRLIASERRRLDGLNRGPLKKAEGLPKATHQGKMLVGDIELDCYVLEDGRRVIHKRGMAKALNLKSAGGNAFLVYDEKRHRIRTR